MLLDVEITKTSLEHIGHIGEWLDKNMPNPPLPEPQRWTIGYDHTQTRLGIKFANEKDAMLFILRWS